MTAHHIQPIFYKYLVILGLLFLPLMAFGQQKEAYVVAHQGHPVILMNQHIALGQGWNLYRKSAGDTGFVKVNEIPITPVLYPEILAETMKEDFSRFLMVSGKQDAATLQLYLLANRDAGDLAVLFSKEAGWALGRRFDDVLHPANAPATYKLVMVNESDQPTGKEIEIIYTPRMAALAVPINPKTKQKGLNVSVEWGYPVRKGDQDLVVHFEIVVRSGPNEPWRRAHEDFILRDDLKTIHKFSFNVLKFGDKLEVAVRAIDIVGNTSAVSASASVNIADDEAPGPIAEVSGSYFEKVVYLTWPMSPEADLAGYHIYRSDKEAGLGDLLNKNLQPGTDHFFEDSTTREGKAYLYRVVAVDAAGNPSAPSAALQIRIPIQTPPPTPKGLTASIKKDKIARLSWQPAANVPNLMHAFVIRQDPSSKEGWQVVLKGAPNLTNFSDVGPEKGYKEGAFYNYGVFLMDSARNTGDTLFVKLQVPDLTPPEAPLDVHTDLLHNSRVQLYWKPSTSSDVSAYKVYKTFDGKTALLQNTTAMQTQISDEAVVLGSTYTYEVTAIDSLGNESVKASAPPLLVRTYDPPRKIQQVQAIPLEMGVQVTWGPNPEKHVVRYHIFQSPIATGVFTKVGEAKKDTLAYLHQTGEIGMWYRVSAIDTFGNESAMSQAVLCK